MKIVIAYDQKLIADCLKAYLSHYKPYEVVGMVNNNDNPTETIHTICPELIIFELMWWSKKYIDEILKLSSQCPRVKILVISELLTHDLMLKIMPYIHGYLVKTCPAEKVIMAIQEIQESGKYLSPIVANDFFSCSNCNQEDTKLTSREKQILGMWVDKETYNAVANTLHISESTVRTHLKNIREKLGNVNQLQMMIYACSHNLLGIRHKPICSNCRFYVSAS